MKILVHTVSLKGMDTTRLTYNLGEPIDLRGEPYITLATGMGSVNEELMSKLPKAEAEIVGDLLAMAEEFRINSITIYPLYIKFLLFADINLAMGIADKIIRSIPLSHLVLEKSESA